MTDHHDPAHGDDHDFEHDFQPVDEIGGVEHHLPDDQHDGWDEPVEHHETWEDHQPAELHAEAEAAPQDEVEEHETPEEAQPVNDEPVDLFPPQVEVGPLPEPVDGFPWIDSSSLGLIDAGVVGPAATMDPHELAEYAAEELPPAQDPWAALAESEDPATAALAKFYRPDSI